MTTIGARSTVAVILMAIASRFLAKASIPSERHSAAENEGKCGGNHKYFLFHLRFSYSGIVYPMAVQPFFVLILKPFFSIHFSSPSKRQPSILEATNRSRVTLVVVFRVHILVVAVRVHAIVVVAQEPVVSVARS